MSGPTFLARRILEDGALCHVAASTPLGPHVTPMVFVFAAGRIWVTTSRGSVKARAWRRDPRVAGLVRSGTGAVCFTGTVRTHDALDVGSWGRSIREAPAIALATARFTRKNARFFAGYAVDAQRVPLAWTPPGRVFVEIAMERTAIADARGRVAPDEAWADGPPSVERFRAARAGRSAFAALPPPIAEALGGHGRGALAIEGSDGPVVLPAQWLVRAAAYAVVERDALALVATPTQRPRVALAVDRASSWRARHMVGAMVRGVGEIAVVGSLTSGARSASEIAGAAGSDAERAAVVRVRPERFVWWRGWESGTVQVA